MASDRIAVMVALKAHTAKVVAALATNCVAELTERTPLDTGWARANWIPSLGAPVVTVSGDPKRVSDTEKQAGLAAMLAYKLEDGSAFVSNPVPYIRFLDGGSSSQAPAGFVRAAIARAIIDTGSGRLVA